MPPNFNPTPKQRFQEDDRRVKAHLALLDRADLQASLEAALMHYQWALAQNSNNLNDAAACHFKAIGAWEFVNVFKRLSEQPLPPSRKHDGQLIHT